jgi:hypothetical protein
MLSIKGKTKIKEQTLEKQCINMPCLARHLITYMPLVSHIIQAIRYAYLALLCLFTNTILIQKFKRTWQWHETFATCTQYGMIFKIHCMAVTLH